jgi:molybdenum cofactor biosynthesis enzyme MoaA
MANGREIDFIDDTIDKITSKYGSSIKMLYLSGSADPFASKSIRKFLLNFDRTKFPNVNHIHLHTNGLLLTEKMWNSLSHIHDLIKTIEISIDAANEDVYSQVRRGGNWDTLLTNLTTVSNLGLKDVRVSFVVQDTNYFQMLEFYTIMMEIFKNKVTVYFNKITNWGTYSDTEFLSKQIWSPHHTEFTLFIKELDKINKKYRCIHNMYDIINAYLPKKINGLI